jgi:hypothetical protein
MGIRFYIQGTGHNSRYYYGAPVILGEKTICKTSKKAECALYLTKEDAIVDITILKANGIDAEWKILK